MLYSSGMQHSSLSLIASGLNLYCYNTMLFWCRPTHYSTNWCFTNGTWCCHPPESGPVVYASKALTATEFRSTDIEMNLVAVVLGCECFCAYIYGHHVAIEYDHIFTFINICVSIRSTNPGPMRCQPSQWQQHTPQIPWAWCHNNNLTSPSATSQHNLTVLYQTGPHHHQCKCQHSWLHQHHLSQYLLPGTPRWYAGVQIMWHPRHILGSSAPIVVVPPSDTSFTNYYSAHTCCTLERLIKQMCWPHCVRQMQQDYPWMVRLHPPGAWCPWKTLPTGAPTMHMSAMKCVPMVEHRWPKTAYTECN